MAKRTQTIRRQIDDELSECVDYFVKLAVKWLTINSFEKTFCKFSIDWFQLDDKKEYFIARSLICA